MTLVDELAALTPEQRAVVEKAAEQAAADAKADPQNQAAPYDLRQDGPLQDPRSLGPVGG